PSHAGDTDGGLLLLDAARLSLRNGAGPFRSLGHLAVTPRPYQFVPLIMALRLDPVRLLIADDVGVGKTIEAAMIARELLDRGLASRLAVICPAHLCDQWETELREKFGIEAAVVQPSRVGRLQRDLPRRDLSIFQYYRHLVASIDFIKAGEQRTFFLRNAPDLVIVDEAHMDARPRGESGAGRSQHQRYEFLRALAADPNRQLILVTATPHSGIEESFRSLLGLLDPAFDLPPEVEIARNLLLPRVVQRRRRDLERWLGTETPFPTRVATERTYPLSPEYRALYDDVVAYCRETLGGGAALRAQQQRVRHWAAIALLRCVLSSPDAAVAVLRERAKRAGEPAEERADPATAADVDATYRPQVLDPADEEQAGDYVPRAPLEDADPHLSESERRRLARFLRRAGELRGPELDRKLAAAASALGELLGEHRCPIVFCRYIATAKYLEAELPRLLEKVAPGLRVVAVTGEIGDEERRAKIEELAGEPVRILVATDCLSEGINLQEHFDAVLHYDLPWNPNRLEQREGRVDRFGQTAKTVPTILLSGADNEMDRTVLQVLIRKARVIHERLGVSVPVPVDAEQVIQAVLDTVLLREGAGSSAGAGTQLQLAMQVPEVSRYHEALDASADRVGRERAFFAQHGIKPDEVARELEATDPVLGDEGTIRRFLANAAQRFAGVLRPTERDGVFDLVPGDLGSALRARGVDGSPVRLTFDPLADPSALCVGRTHPLVGAYCDAVLGAALSPEPNPNFARCGARFTDAVQIRTGVLLLRLRYLLKEQVDEFAEEVVLVAFEPGDGPPRWIEPFPTAARDLLARAEPRANMSQGERAEHIAWALRALGRD
ncbi:MAG TPA: helicase-related protein, partial [Gaiellaceae bacterium]|nr:helicase-related protein [Gaiellaceae bacterium]